MGKRLAEAIVIGGVEGVVGWIAGQSLTQAQTDSTIRGIGLVVIWVVVILAGAAAYIFRPWARADGQSEKASGNAAALEKLRILRRVGVHFLKQGNALPYVGTTSEAEEKYRASLEQHANAWQKMVLDIKPETHGAENEWDRFDVLGNITMDTISQMIARLDDIIARLDEAVTGRPIPPVARYG